MAPELAGMEVIFVGNDLVLDPKPALVDRISAAKTWNVDVGTAVRCCDLFFVFRSAVRLHRR